LKFLIVNKLRVLRYFSVRRSVVGQMSVERRCGHFFGADGDDGNFNPGHVCR
jgi:hypothetical protein